jgi:hypothetical protein
VLPITIYLKLEEGNLTAALAVSVHDRMCNARAGDRATRRLAADRVKRQHFSSDQDAQHCGRIIGHFSTSGRPHVVTTVSARNS